LRPIRVAPDVHIAADTRHSARLPRKPASFPDQFYSIRPRFPRQRANDRAPDEAPAATSPEVNPDDPVDADVHAAVVAEVSPTHVPPRSLRETNETRPSPRAFLYPRQRHFSFIPFIAFLFAHVSLAFSPIRSAALAIAQSRGSPADVAQDAAAAPQRGARASRRAPLASHRTQHPNGRPAVPTRQLRGCPRRGGGGQGQRRRGGEGGRVPVPPGRTGRGDGRVHRA
jgi:hypothetical protein